MNAQYLNSSHALIPAIQDDDEMAWVQIMPAGEFTGRDGRGPYRSNLDLIMEAFQGWGMPLAIDYEHQSLDAATKSAPTPAAGWIHAIEPRQGEVWAQVKWTPRAKDYLKAGEYRYLSPVFRYSPSDGSVQAIIGAGLTNSPNLYLQAAAARQESTRMTDMIRIAALVGLPESATADDVAAKIQGLIAQQTILQTERHQIGAALGVDNTADTGKLLAAVTAKTDASQFVPRAEHDRLVTAYASLQTQSIERTVADAIQAGKVTPALKEWATDYATRDFAGFQKYVEAAPCLVAATQKPTAEAPVDTGKPDLKNMGLVERCKAEWEHDPKLRDEFMDLDGYTAYMQANSKGLIRMLRGAEEREAA